MVHKLLTPEDVAAMVQVEPAVVLAWIEQDQLDAILLAPGVLRVDPTALRKFLLVRRTAIPARRVARAADGRRGPRMNATLSLLLSPLYDGALAPAHRADLAKSGLTTRRSSARASGPSRPI